MASPQIWFDLDLSRMGDEELVVLAKECEYAPARDELLLRYRARTDKLLSHKAKLPHLSAADVEDAQQDAVFWVMEAVERYDTGELGRPGGCSFRSFHYQVVSRRFQDYVRHLCRMRRHAARPIADAMDQPGVDALDNRPEDDPVAVAEEHEAVARLEQALSELPPVLRTLWDQLASGMDLRSIAARQGVSYEAIKRRRRKLLSQLTARLREQPAGPARSPSRL